MPNTGIWKVLQSVESLPTDPDALFKEPQAASFLAVSERTLQSWRLRGGGPVFIRAGRAIRYRRRDLLDWIEANAATSTSSEADK